MNVGNIVTLVAFILAGVGAWYDVKSDVKVHQIRLDNLDRISLAQEARDAVQDATRDKHITELKALVREENRDVKQEIRDWRNEFMSAGRKLR